MTYREINDHLPEDMHDTDQIENVVNMINDMGILVYDKAPEPDALLLKEDSETDEEDTEAALTTAVESEFGRTTDPMRMIETINKLSRIQRQILQEKGREALPEELAERMDMPEEKIRKVLKIAKEPVDPDITVALYPDEYFPFLRDSAARECTSTDFTLIAQVDAYNFKDTDTYHGQGLAMHMIVTRNELESFADELENESSRFKRRHALDGSPQPNG